MNVDDKLRTRLQCWRGGHLDLCLLDGLEVVADLLVELLHRLKDLGIMGPGHNEQSEMVQCDQNPIIV